jgi:hypothetical protein
MRAVGEPCAEAGYTEMQKLAVKTLALAAAVAILAAAASARAGPPQLINAVEAASVSLTGPRTLTVCARGTVTTGGWSRPAITPALGGGRGGVYALDFTAVKPEGLATQMVSPIAASFVWRGAPADLKAVRVRGLRGSAVAELGPAGAC